LPSSSVSFPAHLELLRMDYLNSNLRTLLKSKQLVAIGTPIVIAEIFKLLLLVNLTVLANSVIFQDWVQVWVKVSHKWLRQLRLNSYQLFLTKNSIRSVRLNAASALRLLTLPLPNKSRRESSKLRVTSLSWRKSSSLRRKELQRHLKAKPRRTPLAFLPTRTVVLVLLQSASNSKCAHQASAVTDHLNRSENDL